MEHPFTAALTPTEEMVLGFIRAGAMDAEIAVRIGSSIADVKARVASLLAKSGLNDRPALRGWEPDIEHPRVAVAGAPGATAPPAAGPARTLAPFAALAVVAALAGGAAWALATFRGGGDSEGSPAPTLPVADAAASAPLVAAVTSGVVMRALEFDSAGIDFPAEIALILKEGCNGCVGDSRVTRLYRDATGAVRRDVLFEVDPASRLLSVLVDPGGARIVLTTRDPVAAESIVWRSLDGGVSWERMASIEGDVSAAAFIDDGVIAWRRDNARLTAGVYDLYSSPGAEPSAGGAGFSGAGAPLPTTIDGQLLWRGPGSTLVRSDGVTFLGLPIARGASIGSLTPYPDGNHLLVEMTTLLNQSTHPHSYLAVVKPDGTLAAGFTNSSGPIVGVYAPGLALGSTLPPGAAGDAARGRVPAVIDLAEGVVYPITYPFDEVPGLGRFVVAGVARGPFARISTSSPACVPAYAVPGGGAARLRDCLHDGVLVRHGAGEHQVNDTSWLGVITPSGAYVYVDAGYLERP